MIIASTPCRRRRSSSVFQERRAEALVLLAVGLRQFDKKAIS